VLPAATLAAAFARGNEQAVLWHKDATITLVTFTSDFDDFMKLKKFLAKHPRNADLRSEKLKRPRDWTAGAPRIFYATV
jgi:hypothetical protein